MVEFNPSLDSALDVMIHINQIWKNKGTSLVQRIEQKPGRFFNEGIKDINQKAHEAIGPFFRNSEKFTELKEKFEKWQFPITTQMQEIQHIFQKFDEDIKNDPRWVDFQKQIKAENETLSSEQLSALEEDILASYRFKFITTVGADLLKENSLSKNKIKEVSALLQAANGAYQRGNKALNSLSQATQDNYAKNALNNVVVEVNNILKNAQAASQDNRETLVAEQGKALFDQWSQRVDYTKVYGPQAAKALFDQYFSQKKLMEKVNFYQEACRLAGCDIDSKAESLDFTKNELTKFLKAQQQPNDTMEMKIERQKEVDAVDTLAKTTQKFAYFNPGAIGAENLTKAPTQQEYQVAQNQFKAVQEKYLLPAVKSGHTALVNSFIELGANLQVQTQDYPRSLLMKAQDALKGFPRGFPKQMLQQWKEPPARTLAQVAQLMGHTTLAKMLSTPIATEKSASRQSKAVTQQLSRLESLNETLQQLGWGAITSEKVHKQASVSKHFEPPKPPMAVSLDNREAKTPIVMVLDFLKNFSTQDKSPAMASQGGLLSAYQHHRGADSRALLAIEDILQRTSNNIVAGENVLGELKNLEKQISFLKEDNSTNFRLQKTLDRLETSLTAVKQKVGMNEPNEMEQRPMIKKMG